MTHSEKPLFDAIVMQDDDSVATVLLDVPAGAQIRVQCFDAVKNLYVLEDIPLCHKIALRDIEMGEAVLKNGHVIGSTTMRIAAGSHVHVHNLVGRDPTDYL
jgi:altronate dehydratase